MAEFDAGFKIVTRASGQGLTRLAGIALQELQPIGDTLQTTERLADRAFRARNGDRRFIVYFEAYTRWVESAVWSVLAKSGLLSERERLPTRSLVFIFMPQGYRPQQGSFRLEAEQGEPTQQIWFQEVCLWRVKPEDWWEYYPGLMALYPLCDHQQKPEAAVAHAAEAIRHQSLESYQRADLLTTLGFFGKLKKPTLDVRSIIRREEMRESTFFQEIQKEGEQRLARTYILQILEDRFGPEASKEFEQAVNRLEHLEQLAEVRRLATLCRRFSQFRKDFPKEG